MLSVYILFKVNNRTCLKLALPKKKRVAFIRTQKYSRARGWGGRWAEAGGQNQGLESSQELRHLPSSLSLSLAFLLLSTSAWPLSPDLLSSLSHQLSQAPEFLSPQFRKLTINYTLQIPKSRSRD